jgi:serine/threonine protein phosphatase PrpC
MCTVLSHSEAGGHSLNEDAFEVRQHPELRSCWIGALADGQGGRTGGAEAARLACRAVIEAVASRPAAVAARAETWDAALRQADGRVLADPETGFTTLIGFAVAGGQVAGASCGDSALWLMGADRRASDLTMRQVKDPPVGSGEASPTPFAARLPAAWIVLAMTDGVWKYVGREVIWDLLRTHRGPALLEALLARARLPRTGGLQDDFTAVVLEATTPSGPHPV